MWLVLDTIEILGIPCIGILGIPYIGILGLPCIGILGMPCIGILGLPCIGILGIPCIGILGLPCKGCNILTGLPCIKCYHRHRWYPLWRHSLPAEAGVRVDLARNVARSSESKRHNKRYSTGIKSL